MCFGFHNEDVCAFVSSANMRVLPKLVVCAQFISIPILWGYLAATLTSHHQPNLVKRRGALRGHIFVSNTVKAIWHEGRNPAARGSSRGARRSLREAESGENGSNEPLPPGRNEGIIPPRAGDY